MQETKEKTAEKLAAIAGKLDALGMGIHGALYFMNEHGRPADPEKALNFAFCVQDTMSALAEELKAIADELDASEE